jgi:antitoxin component of RelBE/YafQ-DinJ toxin-antitoxin module
MENNENRDIRISARVPKTVKDKFVQKASEMGLSESKAVFLLADKFIKGEILPDSFGEMSRFERLEEEMRSLKARLEQVEELRKGELAASAPM